MSSNEFGLFHRNDSGANFLIEFLLLQILPRSLNIWNYVEATQGKSLKLAELVK